MFPRQLSAAALALAACLVLAGSAGAATTVTYDKSAFLAATGARDVAGPIPSGLTSEALALERLTLSAGCAGCGTFVTDDYRPVDAGNEIRISGQEGFDASLGARALAVGFDFVEPSDTGTDLQGCNRPVCQDSTFDVTLKDGSTVVGTTQYNAPDAGGPTVPATFVGITSDVPFDRIEIRETTPTDDNEFWGRFYADGDPDGDGLFGADDNCGATANPGQDDADADGEGDPCDRTGTWVMASSDFEDGVDGWEIDTFSIAADQYCDTYEPILEADGISAGSGSISGDDDDGCVSKWSAPAKFRGDLSDAYGGTLTFWRRQAPAIDAAQRTFADDVILEGAGLTLIADVLKPDVEWSRTDLPVTESAWRKPGGGAVSAAELQQVLGAVDELWIRAEYRFFSADQHWLDDVELRSGTQDTTPPQIQLVRPTAGAQYLLGSSQTASYTCTDAGGSGLATCDGTVADGAALDTGTVGSRSFTVQATDRAGNTASASAPYQVIYDWTGFLAPIDNLDANGDYVLNRVKAGSAIPVKFRLGGDQGLDVLAAGSPASAPIQCDPDAESDAVETTVSAGQSSLSYDAATGTYTYVWKTQKTWTGCRQLVVTLKDGTKHRASFSFVR